VRVRAIVAGPAEEPATVEQTETAEPQQEGGTTKVVSHLSSSSSSSSLGGMAQWLGSLYLDVGLTLIFT